MFYSVLYVSRTCLEIPRASAQVEDIILVSRERNMVQGITGALLSTPSFFAQFLEGPRPSVGPLMEKITADPRHMDVTIVYEGDELRRFQDWSMAYSGYASYVDAKITPLFSNSPDIATKPVMSLIRLMQEFVRPS